MIKHFANWNNNVSHIFNNKEYLLSRNRKMFIGGGDSLPTPDPQ